MGLTNYDFTLETKLRSYGKLQVAPSSSEQLRAALSRCCLGHNERWTGAEQCPCIQTVGVKTICSNKGGFMRGHDRTAPYTVCYMVSQRQQCCLAKSIWRPRGKGPVDGLALRNTLGKGQGYRDNKTPLWLCNYISAIYIGIVYCTNKVLKRGPRCVCIF